MASIAPCAGIRHSASIPPDGAITPTSPTTPIPRTGHHLDIPSVIEGGVVIRA